MRKRRLYRGTTTTGMGPRVVYTMSVCRDCTAFMVEAAYPDLRDHGDVRYFDSGMREIPAPPTRCEGLVRENPDPGPGPGERCWDTLDDFHRERGGGKSVELDYGGYNWNNIKDRWLTRDRLPPDYERHRVSYVPKTGDLVRRERPDGLGAAPGQHPRRRGGGQPGLRRLGGPRQAGQAALLVPEQDGPVQPAAGAGGGATTVNTEEGQREKAWEKPRTWTPGWRTRSGPGTITAFMEWLEERGYLLAGVPMHTLLRDTPECWDTPGCVWEHDPGHVRARDRVHRSGHRQEAPLGRGHAPRGAQAHAGPAAAGRVLRHRYGGRSPGDGDDARTCTPGRGPGRIDDRQRVSPHPMRDPPPAAGGNGRGCGTRPEQAGRRDAPGPGGAGRPGADAAAQPRRRGGGRGAGAGALRLRGKRERRELGPVPRAGKTAGTAGPQGTAEAAGSAGIRTGEPRAGK